MSEAEARALATAVAEASRQPTTVEPDGDYFVVIVRTAERGTFALRDEADWNWLSPQIRG